MSTGNLLYIWHATCDVARDIWQGSPAMMVIIGGVLVTVVYFSFKR